ncbi:FAD binding domain-containing protein [Sordaria brevicollis]|uniref:FAD binding domain-containing protein n=1 Tax=Sordaria brevicollis TaxID=83679 RepID=A0AAE0PMX4_SORBR|nr:FAD binding domain-containing protein [Sordaria brevicollis]
MDNCDILIVGAGPVGLTLALELALQGVSFRIIDKSPARSEKSRALIVHPRTLELLARHGPVDRLIARGTIARGAVMNINRKLVTMVDMDDLDITDTEFPLPLMVSQAETEKFMEEALAGYGKTAVERGYAATCIVQDDQGVTTTVERPDVTQITIRSKYVVGCDGAHSIVRHSAPDLTFDGDAYPQDFILCDARLANSNVARDRFTICFGDTGLLAFFPISPPSEDGEDGGLIRLIASGGRSVTKQPPSQPSSSASQQPQHGEQTHQPPTLTHFQSLLESFAPPNSGIVHSPIWLARFRLHHRGVSSYRSRRLFLAGDAAHIHSPAGGQGMNVGIQDAVNLGWKLATAVLNHSLSEEARERLLDSYHAERYPVGRALLQGTDRMFSFTAAASPWILKVRNAVLPWVLPWLVAVKWVRRRFYGFISGFGTSYRGNLGESVVVGEDREGVMKKVRGGDRLPDGKVVELGRTGGRNAPDLPLSTLETEGRKETSLHRICRGASWHLLLFSGIGATGDAVTTVGVEGLSLAGERVLAVVKSECSLHFVFYHVAEDHDPEDGAGLRSDDGALQVVQVAGASSVASYADPGGRVHDLLGLDSGGAGFVMVRPDGYVSHIGYLSSLEEFVREWEIRVRI